MVNITLILSIIGSLLASSGFLILLSSKFLWWWKKAMNKNIAVLLYAASTFTTAVGFDIFAIRQILAISLLDIVWLILFSTSLILAWIPSTKLVRNYFLSSSKTIYWLVVTGPLIVYFVASSSLFLDTFFTGKFALYGESYSLKLSTVFLATIIGILISSIYWAGALKVTKHRVSKHLWLAGFGLFFLSLCVSIQLVHFEFDILTYASSVGLVISSYIYYKGIYSAVISISADTMLHRIVRNQLELIGGIGKTYMAEEKEKLILVLAKKEMAALQEQQGVELPLSDEDIASYLHQAISEVNSSKQGDSIF
jgi:hypothetical protein